MKKKINGAWMGVIALACLLILFQYQTDLADTIGDKVIPTTPDGKPISSTNPLPITGTVTTSNPVAPSTSTVVKGSTSNNGLEVNPDNSLPVAIAPVTTSATVNTINQYVTLPLLGRNGSVAFSATSLGLNTGGWTAFISTDNLNSSVQVHMINPTTMLGTTSSLAGTNVQGTWFIVPVGPATHAIVKATTLSAGSSFVINMSAVMAPTFTFSYSSPALQ